MPKPTLISIFYNEEYLLPFWLEHHKRLFDHGILINYFSTDKSVEIIKHICPTWEIRGATYKHYGLSIIDSKDVDEAEKSIEGWKTILPISEFVFHPDLKTYLDSLCPDIKGVWMQPICLIDEDYLTGPNEEMPLVLQKTFGTIGVNEIRSFNRFIYKTQQGEWNGNGRQNSSIKETITVGDLFYVWAAWSPMRRELVSRKLQRQDEYIIEYGPKDKEEVGYCKENFDSLVKDFEDMQAKHCRSLFFNPVYNYLYKEIEKSYNDKDYKFNPSLVDGEYDYNIQRITSLISSISKNYLLCIRDNITNASVFYVFTKKEHPKFVFNVFHNLTKWVGLQFDSFLRLVLFDKKTNTIIADSEIEGKIKCQK